MEQNYAKLTKFIVYREMHRLLGRIIPYTKGAVASYCVQYVKHYSLFKMCESVKV